MSITESTSWAETFTTAFNDPYCSPVSGIIVGQWMALRFLMLVITVYFFYKLVKRYYDKKANKDTIGFQVKK